MERNAKIFRLGFTLLLALLLSRGWVYGQEERALSPKTPLELKEKLGFHIGILPMLTYERPLTKRTLIRGELSLPFAWGKTSFAFFSREGDKGADDGKYFTGFIPALHAGIRYYPFKLSSSKWVKNRGIYAEAGATGFFPSLRLFPSGAYSRVLQDYNAIYPMAHVGFRAQVLGVLTLDYGIGVQTEWRLGEESPYLYHWYPSHRFSIGITL